MAYLDTSALAKLAVAEPESVSLRSALAGHGLACTSIVGRVEFERVVRRHVEDADTIVEQVMSGIEILSLHVANAAFAAVVQPRSLKSLDAIHLATLIEVRDDIDVFYCYDQQLAAAAADYGIEVVAPS